jgi:hypothetical protein
MIRVSLLIVVAAVLMSPVPSAQVRPAPRPAGPPAPPPPRGFVTINGGYQAASNDFSDGATFRQNAEDGRLDADYSVTGGPALDIAGGATVWRRLGVAIGITRFSRSTPTAVSASVPHPFFFNRPRSVTGDVAGLRRDELAVHVQARGMLPVRGPLQVMVFGGPSFFTVKQDVISELTYTEEYPYDAAGLGAAVTTTASESKVGYNVGADIAYFFTRQLGVGFTAQHSTATVSVPSPAGGRTDVKAGGLQAGGGLRIRF